MNHHFQATKIAVDMTTIPVQKLLNKVCRQKYPGLDKQICPAVELPEVGYDVKTHHYEVYMDVVDDEYKCVVNPEDPQYCNTYIDLAMSDFVRCIRAITFPNEFRRLDGINDDQTGMYKNELVWNDEYKTLAIRKPDKTEYKYRLGIIVKKIKGTRKGQTLRDINETESNKQQVETVNTQFLSDLNNYIKQTKQ